MYNFVGLGISVGEEELEDNVNEESYLTNDVQYEKLVG